MGRRKAEQRVVSASDIPADVLGAVVAADLAQIEADGKTHQDTDARRRILFAVSRLREIAQAELSPALIENFSEIVAILAKSK